MCTNSMKTTRRKFFDMKDNIIIYLDDAVDLDFNISIHMVYNTYKVYNCIHVHNHKHD